MPTRRCGHRAGPQTPHCLSLHGDDFLGLRTPEPGPPPGHLPHLGSRMSLESFSSGGPGQPAVEGRREGQDASAGTLCGSAWPPAAPSRRLCTRLRVRKQTREVAVAQLAFESGACELHHPAGEASILFSAFSWQRLSLGPISKASALAQAWGIAGVGHDWSPPLISCASIFAARKPHRLCLLCLPSLPTTSEPGAHL